MVWTRLDLPFGSAGHTTTAFRLSPSAFPRQAVVALHGAGNDALFAWVGLFKELLTRGTEILTFDLPGHGRWNQGAFDKESAKEALCAAISLCRRPRNEDFRVHGLGVSLGGSVLLHALPDVQDALTSAVLVVAPLQIQLSARSLLNEVGTSTLSLLWRERETYGLTGLVPSFGPFKRDIYPLRLRARPPGPFGYVAVLNQLLTEMHLEQMAALVELPVLLVYGDADRIVPISHGRSLDEILPSSVLHVVQGGTHLSTPLDAKVRRRIVSWLCGDP